MKKPVLFTFMIAALLIAAPAFAGSIYKTEPITEAEKAVGKVLETLHERRKANDARGASELYAEKAVLKFYWGSQDELKVYEGQMSIYIALSNAIIQGAELSDIVVKMVDGGRTAEVIGRMLITINAFGARFLKEPEIKWGLKLDSDGKWRIFSEEHSQVPVVRQ